MVQLEFNLVFWFVSYNIYYYRKKWGPLCSLPCMRDLWLLRSLCLLRVGRLSFSVHLPSRYK
jgi:hypothetical protein